jgi:hypothetical protein
MHVNKFVGYLGLSSWVSWRIDEIVACLGLNDEIIACLGLNYAYSCNICFNLVSQFLLSNCFYNEYG